MPRFKLSTIDGNSERGTIGGEDAHHLLRVHRVQPGQPLEVTSGEVAYSARVTSCLNDYVEVQLLCILPDPECPVIVELMPGLIKADKMEFVIQKAVEIGVAVVAPVGCARSVVPLSKTVEKLSRWEKIAREASKQSGRTRVPSIREPKPLAAALESCTADLRLMAYEGGGQNLAEVLRKYSSATATAIATTVALLVGPEGGFTDAEVSLAQEKGFRVVDLGPRILRAETASLVLLTAVLYEIGDIGGKACLQSPSSH